MTREQAIEVLNMVEAHGHIVIEAKAMAIEALKAEPREDCISREEAIKPFLVDDTEEWTSADIVKYLKSLLSVTPTIRYPQVPGITPTVQADVLENIRAEIEQNAYPIVYGVNNHEKGMTLYGILQIIDKYKAESEG